MSDTSEVNEIEAKVINRLKKTVTIKKELSAKQQAHLDKLSNAKKGKKYTEVVEAKDVELPVEIKAKVKKAPKAPKVPVEISSEASEVVEVVVKKPKAKPIKKVKKQVIVYASESETESEEEIVIKRKPKTKSKEQSYQSTPQERLFMIC